MWQFAVDELEVISSVTCASSEAQTARRWTLGPIIWSEPTGERLSVALVAQLEGPAAMSMHACRSLPARFASLDPPCNACSLVRFVLCWQRLLVRQQRVLPAQEAAKHATGRRDRARHEQDCIGGGVVYSESRAVRESI